MLVVDVSGSRGDEGKLRQARRCRRQALVPDAPATPLASHARGRAQQTLDAQLRLGDVLESELARFHAEMEHLVSSLAIVHGHLVRLHVADDDGAQALLAGELHDLRARVASADASIREAAAQLG